MIKVNPIEDHGHSLAQFIDFPHDLYAGDPYYVPELFIAQKELLTKGKNPFWEHADKQLFLAFAPDGRIVGRIAAIINHNNNAVALNTDDGYFGFFDCVNDPDAANALFDAAKGWLQEQGFKNMIGPLNPSTNDTWGMLLEGFDSSPVIMMPYNFKYYLDLCDNYGFHKKVDLFAHALYRDTIGDKPVRLFDPLVKRLAAKNIVIRPIDLGKGYKRDLAGFAEAYNSAWDKNLGFMPMNDKEFEAMGQELKLVADPQYCFVAEHEGNIVGVALCLPDLNQIFKKIKRGRLLPTGIFKFLAYKFFGWSKPDAIRILALGIKENYRKLGIEACFYAGIMKACFANGIRMAEGSWILEQNTMMNQGLLNMNSVIYKKYRVFEISI